MKSVFGLIFLLFAATNLSISQTSNQEMTIASLNAEANTNAPKTDHKYYINEKSLEAINQLKAHLSENLEYPEVMLDNGINGSVVIKVSLTKKGKVKDISIEESLSKAFDDAVLKAMKNFKSIGLKGKTYEGMKTIMLPINFSMS